MHTYELYGPPDFVEFASEACVPIVKLLKINKTNMVIGKGYLTKEVTNLPSEGERKNVVSTSFILVKNYDIKAQSYCPFPV